VTVEVNQPIRFRGELRSARADLRTPPTRWEATGGTITSDGTFSAGRPGTYRVIGRSRVHRPDTSVVVVVPPQPKIERVRVTPRTPELVIGAKRTFTAVGRLVDGTHTAIRVNWSASGGSISEAGVYRAGDSAGTYEVVARSLRGGHADTIRVVVRKNKESEAAVTRLVLRPTSASLAPSSSLQLVAFGRTESGDSVPVDVTFKATGGTITETGLYTAGQTAGTFRVIATADALADTSAITLASTSGGGTPAPEPGPTPGDGGTEGVGIPFGHFNEPAPGSRLRSGGYLVVPRGDLADLPAIRTRGGRVIINYTAGGKCALDAGGQFQYDLWAACWSRYLTPVRAKVLAYADSGVVVGTYLIDEPNLVKRWGTITPATVCRMAQRARADLPGIPIVVRAAASWLGECQAIDAAWSQYGSRRGVTVEQYRRDQLAAAKAAGYAMIFSLVALNDDGAGTDMTPQQVIDYGTVLLRPEPSLCAFYIWQYDRAWSERSEIRTALDSLGRMAASLPRRQCTRP
jgi:hypothetical protein